MKTAKYLLLFAMLFNVLSFAKLKDGSDPMPLCRKIINCPTVR